MQYEVIGLSGKSGSGKDYIYANYLQPLGFYQVSLAWHFKADLVGKGVITFEEAFITKPPSVRTLMQLVGTELGRQIYGEKVWCNTLVAWMRIFNYHWGITRFAVPDVRFLNEKAFIQDDLGGKVVRVVAPKRSSGSMLDATQRTHASEAEMDGILDSTFDGLIFNDGGDPALDAQLANLFHQFGWKHD